MKQLIVFEKSHECLNSARLCKLVQLGELSWSHGAEEPRTGPTVCRQRVEVRVRLCVQSEDKAERSKVTFIASTAFVIGTENSGGRTEEQLGGVNQLERTRRLSKQLRDSLWERTLLE